MKYLVTGANGELGLHVLNFLKDLVPTDDLFGLVRSKEKAQKVNELGIATRIGTFDKPDSLENAFTGIDRLLFVSSQPGGQLLRTQQHQNVVDAAKKAGITYIVYTSFPKADISESPLSSDHRYTENAISEAKIPHTFLRNNWYLENEKKIIEPVLDGQPFHFSAADGLVGWALKKEYAEAAARVLAGVADNNEVYELSGPLITYTQLAQAVKKVINKEFLIENLSDDTYRAELEEKGLPLQSIAFIMMIQQDIRHGELAVVSNDFEKILNRPLLPLVDSLKILLSN